MVLAKDMDVYTFYLRCRPHDACKCGLGLQD